MLAELASPGFGLLTASPEAPGRRLGWDRSNVIAVSGSPLVLERLQHKTSESHLPNGTYVQFLLYCLTAWLPGCLAQAS